MHFVRPLLLLTLLTVLSGCTNSQNTPTESITVEGLVTVRGNEPFTELVLETADRNSYVLTLTEEQRSAIQSRAPVTVRATGVPYADEWATQRYAHLRVAEYEIVES